MRAVVFSALGAMACGLAAYFVLALLAPEVRPSAYGNLVGLTAVLGGVAGLVLGRRRAGSDSETR
jgi:hypothetical protein